MTLHKLDIPGIFQSEANDLIRIREKSIKIHNTGDIKAAGNEIEEHVRAIFRRMLPKNLYITHGHLIDQNGVISPQLDIIIADTSNLPSLMTTKDGTEYIPIDSVYACGEIKSSYYKSSNYIQSFSNVIKEIHEEMDHRLRPNTFFGGTKNINSSSVLSDMLREKAGNKFYNKIYFFMLFIEKNDFKFGDIFPFLNNYDRKYLPNVCIILNAGIIGLVEIINSNFKLAYYPDEIEDTNCFWYFFGSLINKENKVPSSEGDHLAFLYFYIMRHINESFLNPPNVQSYLNSIMNSFCMKIPIVKSTKNLP